MKRSFLRLIGRQCLALILVSASTTAAIAAGDESEKSVQSKIVPSKTIVGNGHPGPTDTSQITRKVDDLCTISNPYGVEPHRDGSLIITSFDRHCIYRLSADRTILTRIAGLGKMELGKAKQQPGSKAIDMELDQPHEARVDELGNIWVADTRNHRIGKIDNTTLEWTTIAGTGMPGYSGDGGPANLAQFNGPHSLVLDAKTIYIADLANHRVRAIDRDTNVITTIAGIGERALPKEGDLAREQPLAGPRSLALDENNLWIALREGNSVWRMDRKSGTLARIAGTGNAGFNGNGGNALNAELNGPKGIAVDPGKAIYIADTENHQIRKVDLASGVISLSAGDPEGKRGPLARPHGVAWVSVPEAGILVGDSENHQVKFFSKN